MGQSKVKYIFAMVEMDKLVVLEGYKVKPSDREDVCGYVYDGTKHVYLVNRSSEDVKPRFYNKMIANIEELTQKMYRPIEILDIGGGCDSVLAREIASTYKDKVRVTNLDVVLNTNIEKTSNFKAIHGDVLKMNEFSDNSIDFAYSYKLFQWFIKEEKKHRALNEVARVLKPGGMALLEMGVGFDIPKIEQSMFENLWNVKIGFIMDKDGWHTIPLIYLTMDKMGA